MTRSTLRSLRPVVAGMLAAAVLCILFGIATAGASAARASTQRAPLLNWLTDELPGADMAVPVTPGVLPRHRPAAPPVLWRAYDRAAVPRDGLSRSHLTRISLPPPSAGA